MKEFWNVIQAVFAAIGGCDGLLYALVAFVVIDYITGVMCAVVDKDLSSSIGAKGLLRKCCIFIMVGIGHLLDTQIFGEAGVLRTAIIFFYMSNEGLSLTENTAHLGLPIPEKLRQVLKQLHTKSEEEKEGDSDEVR